MSTEAKRTPLEPKKPLAESKAEVMLDTVETLSDPVKHRFLRGIFERYPQNHSTYGRLRSQIKTALDTYPVGFFGISKRRHNDIQAMHKFCDQDRHAEGRSAQLAYEAYQYATQQIVTGFLGRSRLRDNVLEAIEAADKVIFQALKDLDAQEKLAAKCVSRLSRENPSVIQLQAVKGRGVRETRIEGSFDESFYGEAWDDMADEVLGARAESFVKRS